MIILNAILILAGIAAVASIVNLINKRTKSTRTIPMEVQLPGGLPIITLSNKKGEVMNFLIDSGSNISHICTEYFENLDAKLLGVYEEGEVAGLGATNTGITMCQAVLFDVFRHEYKVNLSISNQLTTVADNIERNTGVRIHGLLGTDFLKEYNCIIDFRLFKTYLGK